jgi:drug/metabolite transporter (DMT)-like permease
MDTLLMTYAIYVPAAAVGAIVVSAILPGWRLSPVVLLWTGLAAFSNWLGVIAYLKAMSKAEASYVLGITAGYPVIMQIIAMFALGERLVLLRIAGSLLIFLGVFIIGMAHDKVDENKPNPDTTKLSSQPDGKHKAVEMAALMIVAMLGWGSMGIFDKLAVQSARAVEAYMGVLIWNAAFALISWTIMCCRKKAPLKYAAALWKFPTLSALCLLVGGLTYISALSISTASYVIVITGCYPLLMYGFALWLLGEKLNRARLGGIAILVVGGICTQLTQSQ